jgi:hypothetical protein
VREQAAPGTPLLAEMLEEIAAPAPEATPCLQPRETIVAECLDADHPSLVGRVLVRWSWPSGERASAWIPTLHGLPVRAGDRVLVTQPSNAPEPIVLGVVDGFAARPERRRETAARVELRRDEAVRVTTVDGTPLVELFQGGAGPVVRLLTPSVDLDLLGDMRLSAKSIALIAREGELAIKAHDDVNVEGETINLNS